MEIKKFMDLIPDGKDKAIKRRTLVKMADMCGFIPNNVKDKDRYVRKLISKERQTTPILAKPEGGYYVPTPEDTTELAEYIATEKGRALVILSNVSRADTIFEDLLHGRISEVRRSDD